MRSVLCFCESALGRLQLGYLSSQRRYQEEAMQWREASVADEELRVLLLGCSGPSQFALTNYILGREEFGREVRSIAGSRKNLGELEGRRVAVINTPNFFDKDLSRGKMKEELKRAKCLSSPGPHVVLIALDLENISPNDVKTVELVSKRFGGSVLGHALVLLFYEGELQGAALEDRVMRTDWHLREIVEGCGCRYHVFSRWHRDPAGARELLGKMERVLADHGGQFYTSRLYVKAEESVRKEEKRLAKKRAGETERAWQELERQYQGEELRRHTDAYNTSIGAEIRARAELDNQWLRTSIWVGLGSGFAMGIALGLAIGSVEGPVGIAVGGALGGAVGGVTGGAVQVAIGHLEDRIGAHPRLSNFNSAFINRFFRSPR